MAIWITESKQALTADFKSCFLGVVPSLSREELTLSLKKHPIKYAIQSSPGGCVLIVWLAGSKASTLLSADPLLQTK